MGAKENNPDTYEDEIQGLPPENKVSRLVNVFNNSDNHISTESMALTSMDGKDHDKKSKKDKKKKARKDSRDSKVVERLIPRFEGKKPKPLRSRSHENHDGYLKAHRDHRIRSTTSADHEKDPCFLCLRNALHCYNIVVLVLGVGLLGVGVWLLVTDFSAREVSVIINNNLFEIGTYFILAGGGLVALLAFCGCCGTMREDRCILGFYGVVLGLVFLALLAGGALAFLFRDSISNDIKEKLRDSIQYQYGVDVRTNTTNRLVTDAWDSMQRKLECCGAFGSKDSTYSWGVYRTISHWYIHRIDQAKYPMVPDSCCKEGMDKLTCQGNTVVLGPPNYGPGKDMPNNHKNEHMHVIGCYEKMMEYIQQYALILGAVAFAVPSFLIVGSVIAFCLCARVRKSDTFDEDEV